MNLPVLYQHIDRALREEGLDLCDGMQEHLRAWGHQTTNWRFDAETEPRLQSAGTAGRPVAQPVVEFTYERDNERRQIVFLGPTFVWDPTIFTAVTPVGAMPQEQVRDFFRKIREAGSALASLLRCDEAMGHGVVPWHAYGHQSDLMCLLVGVPGPTVLDVPIEDVLPTGCLIHLVDGGDGRALSAALTAVAAVQRRDQRAVWFDNPHVTSWAQAVSLRCVEEAIQAWGVVMAASHPVTGEPARPALIVFREPFLIPTMRDVEDGAPGVGPEAAVMWANVLPQMLLHDTTIIAFHSIRGGISEYPRQVPVDVQPWRANARYERVYVPVG